jgi:hypothetical protein
MGVGHVHEPATLLHGTAGDAERHGPNPAGWLPHLRATCERLREGLGHRVIGDVSIPREEQERALHLWALLPVDPFEIDGVDVGVGPHHCIVHLTDIGGRTGPNPKTRPLNRSEPVTSSSAERSGAGR